MPDTKLAPLFPFRAAISSGQEVQGRIQKVDWHTVPEPVLTVRLDGSVEYETSDGEVRLVQAGSFVLVEDTHGKGHLSRHSPAAQTVIWISLPNGLDLPPA